MYRLWVATLVFFGANTAVVDPVEVRIDKIVQQMTLDEKIHFVSGDTFQTNAIAHLGVPSLKMSDGPLGVRWGSSTSWPAGVAMGASFDPELVGEVSAAMGVEAKALGRDMLLGPCVNIARHPLGGRDFESFGEDPYLSGAIAARYIQRLQQQHVIATVKHFALNNQETNRLTVDVKASERTMQEIYFPAFHAAVKAGAWSVMSSYNRLNGPYTSESGYLLTKVLKQDWGFRGFVVSDWGANQSTVPSANAGLDLEMPQPYLWGDKLKVAVENGQVKMATIDDKVRRVLRVMIQSGVYDQKDTDRPPLSELNSIAHQQLSQKLAEESMVLLKNAGPILPLENLAGKTIAVIGPNAFYARTGGGGSSHVTPFHAVSPLQALHERLPAGTHLVASMGTHMSYDFDVIDSASVISEEGSSVRGFKAEYFDNPSLAGTPRLVRIDQKLQFDWSFASPDPSIPRTNFSVRWTGKLIPAVTGQYTFTLPSDDGARLFINDHLVTGQWTQGIHFLNGREDLVAGQEYDIRVEYFQLAEDAWVSLGWFIENPHEIADAEQMAAHADVVLLFVGASGVIESENFDRASVYLPEHQEELVDAVTRANANTVVIVNSGAPFVMGQWLPRAKAVLQAWYGGEQTGYATANLLLGDVNPSGKLPVTFLKRLEDTPGFLNFPGQSEVHYDEGIYVGYRHFDKHQIDPEFPFGFGLSYTQFALSNLRVTPLSDKASHPAVVVTATLTNTGDRAGAEVAQLYVSEVSPQVDRPPQELKGFAKVRLRPGESRLISFKLGREAFAYFDEGVHRWKVNPGAFEIRLGISSRDIRLRQQILLKPKVAAVVSN